MQRTVAPAGAAHRGFMMDITVEADCAGQLRHLLTGTCGDLVSFMQTQTIDHARKIKLCFCVSAPAWNLIMSAIMQALPSAEFGRITRH
ncbi:hypothetical protein [Paraherbaspirillum soli]